MSMNLQPGDLGVARTITALWLRPAELKANVLGTKIGQLFYLKVVFVLAKVPTFRENSREGEHWDVLLLGSKSQTVGWLLNWNDKELVDRFRPMKRPEDLRWSGHDIIEFRQLELP